MTNWTKSEYFRKYTSDDVDHGDGYIRVGWSAAVAATVCLSNLNCMKYVFYANFLLSGMKFKSKERKKKYQQAGHDLCLFKLRDFNLEGLKLYSRSVSLTCSPILNF